MLSARERLEELLKLAKIKTELQPHQQRVVDRIQREDQPGLVVVHGLGSGKTLSSIAAQDALKMPAQVVAPAALLGNYQKERQKHLDRERQPAELVSMQNMATKGQAPDAPLLVVDEAHRARDPGSVTFQTLKGNTSQKRLLLTGSPFYNHPSDIAPLVNLAADAKILPYERDDFARRYITERTIKPGVLDRAANLFRSEENKVKPGVVSVLHDKMAPELKQHFAKWVDYHPGSTEGFPEVKRKDVAVPMSSAQLKVYDTLMDQAPAWVAAKVKRGLPPDKREAQQLNSFLTAARQAANTTAPFVTEGAPEEPKIEAAFKSLQSTLAANPRAKAVVYSNYLDAGINPYKKRLEAAGIPFGEFTGELPRGKRDELVRAYNEGKIRSLLLSSAGGEGLDLKGTRLLQILDPHWNNEKLKQVEGRGARYLSHAHLPEEERKLTVERYLASRPQGLVSRMAGRLIGRAPDKSVDEYLAQMAQGKENLIGQFRALLPNQPVEPKPAMSKAAKAPPTTEESRAVASSWGPRLAAGAAFTLPGVVIGAQLGRVPGLMARDPGLERRGGLAGGALGGLAGHALGDYVTDNLTRTGREMARQAIRKPEKEVGLREGAGRVDWGEVGRSVGRSIPSAAIQAVVPLYGGRAPGLGDAAAVLGSAVSGAIGSGFLDKYRHQIAVHELDNARVQEEQRDAERLHRLRRQVAQLEDRVEGDGWKKMPSAPAEKKPDASGKNW